MTGQRLSRHMWIVLLLLSSVTLAGCELAGDIFKAGIWVGMLAVLIVVALIGFIAAKVRS